METHILSNISRSKGNQTLKFDQLIKYTIKTIFLKKHTQNVVRKLVSDPSIIKSKLRISLDQQPKVLQSLFLLYIKVEFYENVLKLRC